MTSRAITRRAIIKQIADYYELISFTGYKSLTHQEKKESHESFREMHGLDEEPHTKEEAMIALKKKLSRVSTGMLKHLNQKLASGECKVIWDQIKYVPEERAALAERMASCISFGYFREYPEMSPDERLDVLQSIERVYDIRIEMPPDLMDEPREVAGDYLIGILFEMKYEDLLRIDGIFKTGKNCMYVRPDTPEPPQSKKSAEGPVIMPKTPEREGPVFVDTTETRDGWSPASGAPKRSKGRELPSFGQGYLTEWEKRRDREEENPGYTTENPKDE